MSITGIRWAGPRAWLAELTDLASVLTLHQRILADPFPGQLDAVAAAATLLVKFSSRQQALVAHAAVGQLDLGRLEPVHGSEVTIDVVYDGEDLAEVGRLTGLGADGVVAAHTGQLWTAAFGGFAPGFTYLVGEDNRLEVPRRTSPRTSVPAGAVALGGAFSAVYPRQSPGGWQLIGRTAAVLWDLDRESPALIRPGDSVRYRAVREVISTTGSGRLRRRGSRPVLLHGHHPCAAGHRPGAAGPRAGPRPPGPRGSGRFRGRCRRSALGPPGQPARRQ